MPFVLSVGPSDRRFLDTIYSLARGVPLRLEFNQNLQPYYKSSHESTELVILSETKGLS